MKKLRLLAALLLIPTLALATPDDGFDGNGQSADIQPPQLSAAPNSMEGQTLNEDDRFWITVNASDNDTLTKLSAAGLSIEETQGGKVTGIAGPHVPARLAKMKNLQFTAIPLLEHMHLLGFPEADKAYHTYSEVQAKLKEYVSEAPELASFFSIGQSLKGKEIMCVRFNSTAKGQEKSSKPGIMFFGEHHAREHLSVEVPLMLVQYLVEHRDEPDIKKLLDTRDIYIIPMTNPDGAEYDITGGEYHWFRKNVRNDGQPKWEIGVDLNRNYGYHWGTEGASADPTDETYRGPSAFSEPETRAVKTFVDKHADKVKIILTYHTFSELILYPWGYTNSPLDDSQALSAYRNMAQVMGQMTGYTPEQSSELYLTSGDLTDWSWGAHHIFSFTFELTPKDEAGGGFYPGPSAIESTFEANIEPALYLIDLADNPYRAADQNSSGAAPLQLPAKPMLMPMIPGVIH